MSPRQKETLLIGLSYLEAHHESDIEFIELLKENIDKDELIYALTYLNSLIAELASRGSGISESPMELLSKTRYIIENRQL